MYRQGDILLIPIKSSRVGASVLRENGDVVLAHGEATGHKHRIPSRHADLFERPGTPAPSERILRARALVRLLHEEHDTIELPKGTYRVIRQREYAPEAIRMVAD
jgi:hypothetical protein